MASFSTINAQRADCKGLLFSASEDFTMQQSEGPDSNPIVSDGDLLAFTGAGTTICRCHREIFVSSTELDDPNG